jgi:hypothetical protein
MPASLIVGPSMVNSTRSGLRNVPDSCGGRDLGSAQLKADLMEHLKRLQLELDDKLILEG